MLPSAGRRFSGGLDVHVAAEPRANPPSPDVLRAYWSLRRAEQRDDERLGPVPPDSSEGRRVAPEGRLPNVGARDNSSGIGQSGRTTVNMLSDHIADLQLQVGCFCIAPAVMRGAYVKNLSGYPDAQRQQVAAHSRGVGLPDTPSTSERRPGAEEYHASPVDLSGEQPEGGADHIVLSTLAEHPARGTMAGQNVTQRVVSERVVSRRRLVSQTQIVSDFMESFGEAGIDDSPYTTRFTIFRRAGLPNSDQDASAFISPPHPTRQRSAIHIAPSQETPDPDPDGSAPNALPDLSRERIARNFARRGQLALGTRFARLATSHILPPSTLAEPARPQVTANRVADPLIQLQRHLDHAQFTIVPSGQLVT
jgi:hypothetical protein